MTKLVQYVCDACGSTTSNGNEIAGFSLSVKRVAPIAGPLAFSVYREHVCSGCARKVFEALGADPVTGERLTPKVTQINNSGSKRATMIQYAGTLVQVDTDLA